MSPILHHESTRVPVTALAACDSLLIAAEGPFLRFYHAKSSRYIASKRVFKAQTVHGICVYPEELGNVTKVVIWGGHLVRALQFNILPEDRDDEPLSLVLSNVVKAPDWILDLAPQLRSLDGKDVYSQAICAAVTAHNALLQLTVHWQTGAAHASSPPSLCLAELTTSSRSILYSAHLLWESPSCILVAAGTAFGEIMYWSWNRPAHGQAASCIHQVFLGHEGSIFDVRISKELQRGCCGNLKRVIASCSDDRTIRLWDVSDVEINTTTTDDAGLDAESQRTRHTGFSIAATEVQSHGSNCLAIGWGHTSRVWKVRFLDPSPGDDSLALLSAGEDATSRTWRLASTNKEGVFACTLQETDCAAYHNGKNMWAMTTYRQAAGQVRIACGAADSKLTTYPLLLGDRDSKSDGNTSAEYSVQNLLYMIQPSMIVDDSRHFGKSSKKVDSIRSYCFISDRAFLLVMNSGKILNGTSGSDKSSGSRRHLIASTLVDQLPELSGYSICVGMPAQGIAFLAGAKGGIYMFCGADLNLQAIHTVTGKVGSLFTADLPSINDQKRLLLLITLVGQRQAQLLFVDLATNSSLLSVKVVPIPLSDVLTGPIITSMSAVETDHGNIVLFLGFRRGSIGLYHVSHYAASPEASLFRVLEKVHGDETVTGMRFRALSEATSVGYLYSVGRDSCLAMYWIDLARNKTKLVHNLVLPIGPNIEDLYFNNNRLLLHGFSSKKWILYDVTSEKETMGIETGGAHRSWAFQPSSSSHCTQAGGTLIWTRASSLHICSQKGSNHEVLRSGGHGREIKAVAVSRPNSSQYSDKKRCLIATGAEDTDIKIFQYIGGELLCRTTLRKHTTGIQHLQWSDDGKYLFSSAGSEEFYVWRVQALKATIDIGVFCEYVYTPESEFSDLRIMSFNMTRHGSAFTIAMVFSDSSVKTYRYDPTMATRWQALSTGIYFTSCLTQCMFLSPTALLTAGTDGHAVVWPVSADASTSALKWQDPLRIHQNASKAMSSHANDERTTLIVSGGDDGALAFLLADTTTPDTSLAAYEPYACPPVLVNRAHGSAVTSCAIARIHSRLFVLTSGNDEWVRLWEVVVNNTEGEEDKTGEFDRLTIKRLSKVKTSVADVSSMAVLDDEDDVARVLLCGVGMEVVRLEASTEQ